jgi:hypothetical protein
LCSSGKKKERFLTPFGMTAGRQEKAEHEKKRVAVRA